ncbi:FeoA family protein [Effusibacillus lacus]|uniref:Iron transporter FeoA n=1 Tax=Effusibacillus lacus TaxID=1348429 RepID=A0A292YIV1_9BACL|nr:FeoA family protein [Effusibacillus lacus]TCS71242.1 ferrous iron transport protein A [Effusibacillus lacus]GAX89868.1 iron transporter FeoA [Effusibacillus lacus]
MFLADIQFGTKVLIANLDQATELVRKRLNDFGILEGMEVCVTRSLPFGGPITIESNGQRVGIRRRDARLIEVVQCG